MQSIIVYRNPMEAAFWESVSDGQIVPVMAGIVVFFLVFLALQKVFVDRFFPRIMDSRRQPATYTVMFLAAMIAVAVAYRMWI